MHPWRTPGGRTDVAAAYENKRSLELKHDMVNARDLAGLGLRGIGY